jgi:serine/threonine kinase 16
MENVAQASRQCSPYFDVSMKPHSLLTNFESSGPLQVSITSQADITELVKLASQYTTMAYRPPELLEGGLQYMNPSNHHNATNITSPKVTFDYRAVDVWSLGCTLHATMYGASPFECEFVEPSSFSSSVEYYIRNDVPAIKSMIKILDCTPSSILGKMPIPEHAPVSLWFSDAIRNDLLLPMLRPMPIERPELTSILMV